MVNLKCIIFSKDRALQLDLLLRSLKKYRWSDEIRFSILFRTSTREHKESYDILQNKHPEFEWIPETNFHDQVMQWLSTGDEGFCMHMVDDTQVILPVEMISSYYAAMGTSDQLSLRMCRSMSPNNLSVWDSTDYSFRTDIGYPFSVDAHIYRTIDLDSILSKDDVPSWNNPNSYEGEVALYCKRNHLLPKIAVNTFQAYVNTPTNVTQEWERYSIQGISEEELLQYFMDGYELEYDLPAAITKPYIDVDHIKLVKRVDFKKLPRTGKGTRTNYDISY